jgi:hypothetical protein
MRRGPRVQSSPSRNRSTDAASSRESAKAGTRADRRGRERSVRLPLDEVAVRRIVERPSASCHPCTRRGRRREHQRFSARGEDADCRRRPAGPRGRCPRGARPLSQLACVTRSNALERVKSNVATRYSSWPLDLSAALAPSVGSGCFAAGDEWHPAEAPTQIAGRWLRTRATR